MANSSIIIKKQIHCPASYYFCSGYIPALAQELYNLIDNCQKNKIKISSINMNNSTYNWMFRLFTTLHLMEIVKSTSSVKYLIATQYPIILKDELPDGLIKINIGDNNELD